MVTMPRPRLEIAKRFIEHLVELGEHFNDLVIGIAVIGVDIVPRPMTAGPPNDGNILAAQQIASRLHLSPILQFKGDMVHLRALAAHEIDGVMVGTAAHEHKPVLNPIRHAETQNAAIEFGVVPGAGSLRVGQRKPSVSIPLRISLNSVSGATWNASLPQRAFSPVSS